MRPRLVRLGLAAVMLPLGLDACAALAGPDEVRIRIRNASPVAYERVVVWFPEQTVDYGRVDAAQATAYRTVSKAYRYARVEAVVAGDTLVIQPIDFVGERPLDDGDYTYELDLDSSAGALSLRLSLTED